jgi:hypothetical protein
MRLCVIKTPPFEGKPPFKGDVVQYGGTHDPKLLTLSGECLGYIEAPIRLFAVRANNVDWVTLEGELVPLRVSKKFFQNHTPVWKQ